MGAIFSMAPLAVRLGIVRRREKEARRAVAQLEPPARNIEPTRDSLVQQTKGVSRLAAYNARRSRKAKRKAEAKRLNCESAIIFAANRLRTEVRANASYIEEWTQEDGLVAIASVPDNKVARVKPSRAFTELTGPAFRALKAAKRRHITAARKLASAVDAALSAWQATLANLRRSEGRGFPGAPGGQR